MKTFLLSDMVGGWFVGDFNPSILRTSTFEVAVKSYRAGDKDVAHYHKVASELTVVVSGTVSMGGRILNSGDIALIEPGEIVQFEAVCDVTTVVIKVPSVTGDKYVE